jgi:predicted phosphoribosyltransferase
MPTKLKDRSEAGRLLATCLTDYAHRQDCVVVALSRGGAVVGSEVARPLKLTCSVLWGPPDGVNGRKVLLVDDGATESQVVEKAIAALRESGAQAVIFAAPVLPRERLVRLWPLANDVIYLISPEPFGSIESWYEKFPPLTDEEVRECLNPSPRPAVRAFRLISPTPVRRQ